MYLGIKGTNPHINFSIALCSLVADYSCSIRLRQFAEVIDQTDDYNSAGFAIFALDPPVYDVVNVLDQWTETFFIWISCIR